MFKNKKVLAVIPARAASKRLPGKNARLFSGKPLIALSVKQALGSRYIDKAIVSTDSVKIASIARRYGAEVPFMRPRNLATDFAKSMDVVIHALKYLETCRDKYDIVVLLQPTSPLRTVSQIDSALELLSLKKVDAVVSVCRVENSHLWINKLPMDLNMRYFVKGAVNKKAKISDRFYRLNGAIYIAKVKYIKKERSFFGKGTYAYVMPEINSVDIDTGEDFILAEALMKQFKKRER